MSSSTVRTLLCIIGIAVSLYAYDVETKAEHAKETGEEYEVSTQRAPSPGPPGSPFLSPRMPTHAHSWARLCTQPSRATRTRFLPEPGS